MAGVFVLDHGGQGLLQNIIIAGGCKGRILARFAASLGQESTRKALRSTHQLCLQVGGGVTARRQPGGQTNTLMYTYVVAIRTGYQGGGGGDTSWIGIRLSKGPSSSR